MPYTPRSAAPQDEAGNKAGVMVASPHLLDALEALSAMAAQQLGADPRIPLSDPSTCNTTITTTSASATTCKP